MIVVSPIGSDPFLNLALEEYLLRHTEEDCMMLWQNSHAVVVGKHQNTMAEVNYPYVIKKGIPVVRRLSGGGTVFHGPGNLNFTFIVRGIQGKLIDFAKHTRPIVSFLNQLGVRAKFEGKNDLRVDGLKISGNAEHVYKNRVLHHGTLLFNARLDILGEAIRVVPGKYIHKGVQSVRSQVTNISGFLESPPEMEDFSASLATYLHQFFQAEQTWEPTGKALDVIKELAQEKYSTWDWTYGYSPDYSFTGRALIDGRETSLSLYVSKGYIVKAAFNAKSLPDSWHQVEKQLPGLRHGMEDILSVMRGAGMADSTSGHIPQGFIPLFF